MKRLLAFALFLVFAASLCACGKTEVNVDYDEHAAEDLIKVGFSQVGAESDWRVANTQSMNDTFTNANGFYLSLHDAHQRQENQISAIRAFIKLEMDYIVLAPVTETGWDGILGEAKEANIPVIIVDRMIDVSDDDLYTCWVGSNFRAEGDKAVSWMGKTFHDKKLNIAHIQGTLGSSAQIGRSDSLSTGIVKNPNWKIVAAQSANFTEEDGYSVTAEILKKHPEVNFVYCENDDEAFGAIKAIEEAGKSVGTNGDVTVVSFDATKRALEAALKGEISYVVECNPLHGPRIKSIIEQLESGKTPEKLSYIDETAFDSAKIKQSDIDKRTY